MSILEVLLLGGLAAAALIFIVRFESMCLRDLAGTPDERLHAFTWQGWLAQIIFAIPLGGVFHLSGGKWR